MCLHGKTSASAPDARVSEFSSNTFSLMQLAFK
jgi:hypothetical protein